MKIKLNNKLFWFARDGFELDLADPSSLEMYVQQVVSRGREKDVKELLANVDTNQLKIIFSRIGRFLPREVKDFWEDFFADH